MVTAKQIKETAIRLWKNDFPEVPINMSSTEWQLYLVKAEQIENAPTVIDTLTTDPLYTALKSVLKTPATFEKAWAIIVEYRSKFIGAVQALNATGQIEWMPETIWDNAYDSAEVWDEEAEQPTTFANEQFEILKSYLCVEELGVSGSWD